LANTKSAIKNIRKNTRRRERNRIFRSRARTFVKKARRQIEVGELEAAQATAQKGIIHPNNAARRKSRLIKHLNQTLEAQASE
jgi:small subunit ribosomal protein S20